MKKLFLISLLFFSVSAFSQTWNTAQSFFRLGYKFNGINIDSILKLPADTTRNKLTGSMAIKNNSLYIKDATKWKLGISDVTGFKLKSDSIIKSGYSTNWKLQHKIDSLTLQSITDRGDRTTNAITALALYWTDYFGSYLGLLGQYSKYGGSFGDIQLMNTNNSYKGDISTKELTGNRSYELPNTSGTIALTTDIPDLTQYRKLNNHDSLSTLDEKAYSSLTGRPDLTIYRTLSNHDSLSTLDEKDYSSLANKPNLAVYRLLNNHDSLSVLDEKSYNSLTDKPNLSQYRTWTNHDSLQNLDEKSYNSLTDKPVIPDTATINQHIRNLSNPHSVTKTQVGLGSVTNNLQKNSNDSIVNPGYFTNYKGSLKVDKVTGKTLSSNDFTDADSIIVRDSLVHIGRTEIVTGAKTFNQDLTVNGISIGRGTGGYYRNTIVADSSLLFNNVSGLLFGKNLTVFGYKALFHNTKGYNNSVFGSYGLSNDSLGYNNCAVGTAAGSYYGGLVYPLSRSVGSIFIGPFSASKKDSSINEIVIGDYGIGNGNNTATWGNTSMTDHYFTGIIHATGGTSTNWNTAYTYSQVGHLPLSGGTLTSSLIQSGGDFHSTIAGTWWIYHTTAGQDISIQTNGGIFSVKRWSDNANLFSVADATGVATFASTLTATQFKLSALNTAPSSSTDTGTTGEYRCDGNYIYFCKATNTWVRSALTTW